MARRALRAINAALELTKHLKSLREMTPPWKEEDFFSESRPLVVEVGSGKGLFIATAASTFPEKNFVGLEIAKKYAAFCAARLAKNGLNNAVMIEGDAQRFFKEFLPSNSVSEVHVYFPDPWWKARHKKRRVLTEAFLKQVERVLVPGGEFHFWTDVEEYFHSTLEIISQGTTLAGPIEVPEATPTHDLDYRTNFERRKRRDNLPIYRALFLKKSP